MVRPDGFAIASRMRHARSRIRLNSALDWQSVRQRFAAAGRVQIYQFLAPDAASVLHDELKTRTDWRHIINGQDRVFEIPSSQFDVLPAAERMVLERAMHAQATRGFQFQFDTIRVSDGARDRRAGGTALEAFAQLMSAPATLDLFGSATGQLDLSFADAQGTRYRPGDFLTRHDDNIAGKDRRLAYILSLAPEWRPEWGGLLLFNGADDGSADVMVPRFNTLTLFTVGQPHSVSIVAPYAGAPRLSITGWLRTNPPPP